MYFRRQNVQKLPSISQIQKEKEERKNWAKNIMRALYNTINEQPKSSQKIPKIPKITDSKGFDTITHRHPLLMMG